MTVRCSAPAETDRVWLLSTRFSITPRHELVDLIDFVISDAAENAGEPSSIGFSLQLAQRSAFGAASQQNATMLKA